MKKIVFILLFAMLATVGFAYAGQAAGAEKAKSTAVPKPAHWSGAIVRTDKDAATITVKRKTGMEKIIYYDSSTKWTTKGGGTAIPAP